MGARITTCGGALHGTRAGQLIQHKTKNKKLRLHPLQGTEVEPERIRFAERTARSILSKSNRQAAAPVDGAPTGAAKRAKVLAKACSRLTEIHLRFYLLCLRFFILWIKSPAHRLRVPIQIARVRCAPGVADVLPLAPTRGRGWVARAPARSC